MEMKKYPEIYDDKELLELLESLINIGYGECDKYVECEGCPNKFLNDYCIGSILGECWRRLSNKMLDNQEKV